MKANTKPGSPRFGLAPMLALATVLTAPAAALSLGAFATPAMAEAPVTLAAPAVSIAAIVAPARLTETVTAAAAQPKTPYQKIGAGMASYYGRELAGNRTASGERFNPSELTAAHRTLPLGSKVRVTNSRTGDSIVVRINDRGPFHRSRLIDLSEAAARKIGIRAAGRGMVEIAIAAE